MDELLTLFTPEVLTLLAYSVGAFLAGAMIITGLFYIADNFSRWF